MDFFYDFVHNNTSKELIPRYPSEVAVNFSRAEE